MLSIDNILNLFYQSPAISGRTTVKVGEGTDALTLSQTAAPENESEEALLEVLSRSGLRGRHRKQTSGGATATVNKEFAAHEAVAIAHLAVTGEAAPETSDKPKRGRRNKAEEAAALTNGEVVKD